MYSILIVIVFVLFFVYVIADPGFIRSRPQPEKDGPTEQSAEFTPASGEEQDATTVPCPVCAGPVLFAANVCPHCGNSMEAASTSAAQTSPLLKCSECGHTVSSKAVACPGCGAPPPDVPVLLKCSECGHTVSTKAVSCPGCGAPPSGTPSDTNPLGILRKIAQEPTLQRAKQRIEQAVGGQASETNWYLEVWKKCAVFGGRASRREFWMWNLINFVIVLALMVFELVVIDPSREQGLLALIYTLAVSLPSAAVSVRRLHDGGRSGWLFLLSAVPVINFILIAFYIQPSQVGENAYGPSPAA